MRPPSLRSRVIDRELLSVPPTVTLVTLMDIPYAAPVQFRAARAVGPDRYRWHSREIASVHGLALWMDTTRCPLHGQEGSLSQRRGSPGPASSDVRCPCQQNFSPRPVRAVDSGCRTL